MNTLPCDRRADSPPHIVGGRWCAHSEPVQMTVDGIAVPVSIAECTHPVCADGRPGPSHWASPLCRSGKRAHCTCDGCF